MLDSFWKDLLKLPATITRPIGLITLALVLIFALGFFLREGGRENPVAFYGLFLGTVLMLVLAGVSMLNSAELKLANRDTKDLQFLLVIFPERRTVLADGDEVGFTNHIVLLPAESYTLTLSGDGYAPKFMDVEVRGSSIVRPKAVVFELERQLRSERLPVKRTGS